MRSEDILSSDVFSFFKYSNRKRYLKDYLGTLGFVVTDEEAQTARFQFWPTYGDDTEPDLVVTVGAYYLLIEAKYFSDFGKANDKTDAQIVREIREGSKAAKSQGKDFWYVAITADYYYDHAKFREIPVDFRSRFRWTNWQSVLTFIDDKLQSQPSTDDPERAFCVDLREALENRNLRAFRGYSPSPGMIVGIYGRVFFLVRSARFRGDFIGYLPSLAGLQLIPESAKNGYFSRDRRLFGIEVKTTIDQHSRIFFGGEIGRRIGRTN